MNLTPILSSLKVCGHSIGANRYERDGDLYASLISIYPVLQVAQLFTWHILGNVQTCILRENARKRAPSIHTLWVSSRGIGLLSCTRDILTCLSKAQV